MADETKPEANTLDLKAACALLKLQPRRIQQLAQQGWIQKASAGRYPLVALVHGYIDFLRDENEKRTKSAADSRLRDARAREVEQRIAERDRGLISVEEASATVDDMAGAYLESIAGLPARITRNQSERRRLEAICDTERKRLSNRFEESSRALRTGVDPSEPVGEADAGRVGAEE